MAGACPLVTEHVYADMIATRDRISPGGTKHLLPRLGTDHPQCPFGPSEQATVPYLPVSWMALLAANLYDGYLPCEVQ